MSDDPLSGLHPLVAAWFRDRHGTPTAVQAGVWPLLAAGRDALAVAPTGSGKTLAAFLDGISRLASGEYPADRLSILYLSPLKALAEDVRVNLLEPLGGVRSRFDAAGIPFPPLRASVRTGDTAASERRRDFSKPPSILATTPESLSILLNSVSGTRLLAEVRLVIADEVHALVGTKRGAFLAAALGRLALLAGEFRRVALSATVSPVEEAARFVAGFRLERLPDGTAAYGERRMEVVAPPSEKRIGFAVDWPESPMRVPVPGAAGAAGGGAADGADRSAAGTRLAALADEVITRTKRNRSTLVFVDSRRRAESLARMINDRGGEGLAWAHHGSLAKEARRAVERRLKEGRLACVVATASLELGIDIGSVDEVVLAGTPPGAAQALQRIGRSGHAVGAASRGLLLPLHPMDLLRAAAMSELVSRRAVEELRALANPLDILAQVLLGMCLREERKLDALYDEVRAMSPFARLSRADFDAVVDMLSGKYSGARYGELKARLLVDPGTRSARAKEGSATLLFASGGAIADRGAYALREAGSGARLGELDEEYVWERRVGDTLSFGSRSWRIVAIGHEAVEVRALERAADFAPFWKADARFRSPLLAEATLDFLEAWGGRAGTREFDAELERRGFSERAARVLSGFLKAQASVAPLPGRALAPFELFDDPSGRAETRNVVIHHCRGGAFSETLAMALGAELEERLGLAVRPVADEDALLVSLPRLEGGVAPEATVLDALRSLGAPGGTGSGGAFERALARRLEGSPLFGAAFREDSERALLLPHPGFGKRRPLWVARLRAKRLFDAVAAFPDFPMAAQARRDCLELSLDVAGARDFAVEVAEGRIATPFARTRGPSPFAREAGWRETNRLLYQDDGLEPRRDGAGAAQAAIEEAVAGAGRRPSLEPELVARFRARARRESAELAPSDPLELADWLSERVAVPADEWERLVAFVDPEVAAAFEAEERYASRAVRTRFPGASVDALVAAERLAGLGAALAPDGDPLHAVAEYLRAGGPEALDRIGAVFGLDAGRLGALAERLVAGGAFVRVALPRAAFVGEAGGRTASGAAAGSGGGEGGEGGDGGEGCATLDCLAYAEHYGILLRQKRKAARPAFSGRPLSWLPAFVAELQGVVPCGAGSATGAKGPPPDAVEELLGALAPLSGLPLPAAEWEASILPARLADYRPGRLDAAIAAGRLAWYGAGKGLVAFASPWLLEACVEREGSPRLASALPRRRAELAALSGLDRAALLEALWDEAWRGLASTDSFEAVRRGIASTWNFESPDRAKGAGSPGAPEAGNPFGRARRLPAAFRRGPGAREDEGAWFSLVPDDEAGPAPDTLDEAELDAERVRIVAARRGLLCRETFEREAPRFGWARLSRALRRLELSGELVAGRFFEGGAGPQFMRAADFERLRSWEPRPAAYAIDARDPASLASAGFEGPWHELPQRVPGASYAFRGETLLWVARRGGRELSLFVPPDAPGLAGSLGALARPRRRAVLPERSVVVERVDGAAASSSPLAPLLATHGFEPDRGALRLW
ncbi:MAG: DEAD/DEAH box helicase [Spirochaetales bacterium]|nr:DEAD/DEAH box helicase [Spirochaetales bacterium]